MADSATPKCGTCGTNNDTSVNTVDAASPVDSSGTSCGQCHRKTCVCQSGCSGSISSATDQCATNTCKTTDVSACVEDHTQTICKVSYRTTVKAVNTFNFPALGESASITLEKVESLLPGAVLVNQTIGRLHVQSFDAETGVAVVINKGDTDNIKSAGDLIPSCTEFLVGVPSTSTASSGTTQTVPFLGADFVGPASGACQLATVTNVNGLALNDIVSINSFQYRIGDIADATTIQLCNDGEGAPTGQVFKWDANCDGVADIQIISLSSDDPCSRDGVQTGQLVVCEDGIRQPLVGTVDGQVAVWDSTTSKWILVNANITEECTALTVCLVVDPTTGVGPYVVQVASTALFTVGSTILIGEGSSQISGTITTIVNTTQMTVTLSTAPTAITNIAIGVRVCAQDCCAQTVPDLIDRLAALEMIHADPCYPSQIAFQQLIEIGDVNVNFSAFNNGGQFQRHYNFDDANIGGTPILLDQVIGPFNCDAFIEIVGFGEHVGNVLGADNQAQDTRAFHEYALEIGGAAGGGRVMAQYASNRAGGNFVSFQAGQAVQPIPADFGLSGYAFTTGRESMSWGHQQALAAGATLRIGMTHRLSLDGAIQGVNWGNAAERAEWSTQARILVKAWRT